MKRETCMETMKAILCPKYGPPHILQVGLCEKPIPRKDEILIKIYATSVTNSDIFVRSASVPPAMTIPFRLMIGVFRPRNPVIGEVFSGEIERVGPEIRRFNVGDQVYGLTGSSLGAYADFKCMKEVDSKKGCVAIKPANVSFEEATSVAYGGVLALQFLEKGNIARGHKVLIYGASGTSGTFALQYAKHLGAIVTGVCGASHRGLVKSLGAHKVLDYHKTEDIRALETYDFVLDAVGRSRTSELKKACKSALTRTGTYVSIDDEPLLLQSPRLNKIRDLVERGIIKPVTDRTFDFAKIVEAHKYVEGGHKKGNVAITVNRKARAGTSKRELS
jgi:NADPH:quinone reductase-like Zn-dependent oxidoreductase